MEMLRAGSDTIGGRSSSHSHLPYNLRHCEMTMPNTVIGEKRIMDKEIVPRVKIKDLFPSHLEIPMSMKWHWIHVLVGVEIVLQLLSSFRYWITIKIPRCKISKVVVWNDGQEPCINFEFSEERFPHHSLYLVCVTFFGWQHPEHAHHVTPPSGIISTHLKKHILLQFFDVYFYAFMINLRTFFFGNYLFRCIIQLEMHMCAYAKMHWYRI